MLLAFGAILTISSIGLSRGLEESEPDLSLKLFPANAEASIQASLALLRRSPSKQQLEQLEATLLLQVVNNSGDARFYSLLGETRSRLGQSSAAAAAFNHALSLSKTEVYALQWALGQAMAANDAQVAIARMDTLLRRWPRFTNNVAPAVRAFFSKNEDSYRILVEQLNAAPPWRLGFVRALSAADGAGFAARLLGDLSEPAAATNVEVGPVLSALIKAKQYDLAYQTFLSTLTPAEQPVSGYIHNGSFEIAPSGRAFDWQIRDHPGVTFNFKNDAGPGLHMRFANAPVRRLSVAQYMRLPPGAYRWDYIVSASDARLPKSLVWRIICAETNRVLAESTVEPGTYWQKGFQTEVVVPPAGCPLQRLTLSTKAIGENWNDRYGGSLNFRGFSMTAMSS